MNYLTAHHTDIGIRKNTNQDSLLIHQAFTKKGNVLLAAVCDGMGGLAKGEAASAHMAQSFSDWFSRELPELISAGIQPEALRKSWEQLARKAAERISAYASERALQMGTTCTALLLVEDTYYIMNVGDSRIYLLTDDNMYQLTKDHTYIQREMDNGRMTYEQSLTHPKRNVLLQCIGASEEIQPDFFMGQAAKNQCYLLCSDGFRHKITPKEIWEQLKPGAASSSSVMEEKLIQLTELNKQRSETDNISAILIRTA